MACRDETEGYCGYSQETMNAVIKERDELQTINAALREKNERKEDALEQVRLWAQAYPLEVFPEPDLNAIAKLLKEHGYTLDAVSASNMRYVIIRVQEIIDKALKE